MKKFSKKTADDQKEKDAKGKKPPADKKEDPNPKDPQEKEQKGFSLKDDSKGEGAKDDQIADAGDKAQDVKKAVNNKKPAPKAEKDNDGDGEDGKLKDVGKDGAPPTKIDMEPELEIVPQDEFIDESRAQKVIRIAREYRGRTTIESIE